MAKTTGSNTDFSFTRAMQTTTGVNDAIAGDIINDDNAELFLKIDQNGLQIETEINASPERDEIISFAQNSGRGIMKGYNQK